ncbi:MAG: lysoplasmalogenase family protein [Spirosomataceae bacterium]
MKKIFTILYSVIVVVVICSIYKSPAIQLFAKPLITLSLLIYFFFRHQNKLTKGDRLLVVGLIFGLIGDLVIIDESNLEIGICLFLGMYICYYQSFREEGKIIIFKDSYEFAKVLPVILATFFYFGFTVLTRAPSHLLLLSAVYSFLLLIFMIVAHVRQSSKLSYNYGLVSSWCFALSSALFSYRQFSWQFHIDMIFIVIFYSIAQYLYVHAKLEHNKFKNQI